MLDLALRSKKQGLAFKDGLERGKSPLRKGFKKFFRFSNGVFLVPEKYRNLQNERLKIAEKEYASLLEEDKKLAELNGELQKRVSDILHLYELTREMSRSLEMDEIFSIFKKRLYQHFKLERCELILSCEDSSVLKNGDIRLFPLRAERGIVGYLAIKGLKGEDFDQFSILVDQFAMEIEKARLYETIQNLAIQDGLTHIYVRRHFLELYREELKRAERHNSNLSFLMADIDYFKKCNDKYGHLVGDVVLKEVASVIKGNVREVDLLGRYGGEEFSIVLPDTNKEGALHVAERIRLAIERHSFQAYEEVIRTTISLGLAVFPEDTREAQQLIDNADSALYKAKNTGRNRVSAWSVS